MGRVVLVLWLLAAPTISAAAPLQWSLDEGGNGHFYEAVLAQGGIAWSESSAAATEAGGYLATITSATENVFITALISGRPEFWWYQPTAPWEPPGGEWCGPWFGGYQDPSAPDYEQPSAAWCWVTGESWGYTNRATLEPNDAWGTLQQNLTHFIVKGSSDFSLGTWDDAHEGPYYNGYIVEWNTNLVPEPASILALIVGFTGLASGMMGRRRA